jgi:hypothetical protein
MGDVTYNRVAAVAYARQFTGKSTGMANYNNGGFNAVKNGGDCANYISQSLFAGGIPQTDVWYYRTPYTNSGKRTSAWTGTVSMRNFLVGRSWAAKLTSPLDLKKGDIVYTYRSERSLPHVVIVTEDVGSDGRIIICGHTMNQLDAIRGSQASVYYHIHDTISMQVNDRQYVGYVNDEDFHTAMSDFGTMDLSVSSYGANVSNLQRRLKYLGYYSGEIHGAYDTATANAVKAFQDAQYIASDGIAGSNTKALLYKPACRFMRRRL